MSEAVELLANLEEMESASSRPYLPRLRCVEPVRCLVIVYRFLVR